MDDAPDILDGITRLLETAAYAVAWQPAANRDDRVAAGPYLNGEQRRFAETVRSSGETLLTLLNDMLDLSRLLYEGDVPALWQLAQLPELPDAKNPVRSVGVTS
jgi:signal transduction histidine kinase